MRSIWLVVPLAVVLFAGCPARSGKDSSAPQHSAGTSAGSSAVSARSAVRVWVDPVLVAPLEGLAQQFKKSYAPGFKLLPAESGGLPGAQVLQAAPKPPDDLAGVKHPNASSTPSQPAPVATANVPETPADVYIFAGPLAFDGLRESKSIDEASARTFAGDRLVLVQVQGKGYVTPTLFDVYQLRFTAFGTAKLGTSLGDFSEQALISEGGEKRIAKRRKYYDSTDALVKALLSGEVQMAIIYASTAAQTPGLEVMLLIGDDLHTAIRYQAVAATGRLSALGVPELLSFLAENPAVQAQLGGLGLQSRELAMHQVAK